MRKHDRIMESGMRRVLILSICFFVTACASMQKNQTWSHSNKSNQQFYAESSDCQARANTVQIPQVDTSPVQNYGVGYGAGMASFAEGFNRTAAYRRAMAQQEQIYSSCMRGLGWSP